MRKIFALLMVSAAAASCSKDDSSKTSRGSYNDSLAFLLQNSTPPFLDSSSELRCDALKAFFVHFADQLLEGASVTNFSCTDASNVENLYMTKVEFTKDDRVSIVTQFVSGLYAYATEYCGLPFKPSTYPTCGTEPHFSQGGANIDGLMHPNLAKIKDFVQTYVSQKQTKDLAYGMDVEDFAQKWTHKFDGSYKYALSSKDSLNLWLKLIADEKSSKTGIAKFVEANVEMFESGRSFFACKDKSCLLNREYTYIFNGHHLTIATQDGDILTLFLQKTE